MKIEREIKSSLDGIKVNLDFLKQIEKEGSSPRPDLLQRDIKAYEWILKQEDAEAWADKYFHFKNTKLIGIKTASMVFNDMELEYPEMQGWHS